MVGSRVAVSVIRHVIHAPFGRDVFAEHERFGILGENVALARVGQMWLQGQQPVVRHDTGALSQEHPDLFQPVGPPVQCLARLKVTYRRLQRAVFPGGQVWQVAHHDLDSGFDRLEDETLAWAGRVAQNDPTPVRGAHG